MKRFFLFFPYCFFSALYCFATHNRAGEITYKWVGTYVPSPGPGYILDYEITVTTYTKIQSPADRCELTVYFGDGDSGIARRINGPSINCPQSADGVSITSTIRKNIYKITHRYPGNGQYLITMYDPNRNSGIENIPNSVNTPFYIQSWLKINTLLGVPNSSPDLLNPPIDNGCIGKCFYHNPGAADPNGDSLSYRLGYCLGAGGVPVQNASLIPAGISVNPVTGTFTWCTPQPWPNDPNFPQEYNFAMYIDEWRKGQDNQWYKIGYVERDLQVDINNCANNPPVLSQPNDTCVLAGSSLNITVTAYDPDSNIVTLSASGAPMSSSYVNPPATFSYAPLSAPHATGTFAWQTACNMVRKQPYEVVFRAADNDPQNPLVNIKTLFITIIAPAPQNLTAVPNCNTMLLSWSPSPCNPNPNFVTGYKIYRLGSCDNWSPAACETGVPAYTGYMLIGTTSGVTGTSFTDNNGGLGLAQGVTYAYHVVAVMTDGAESYASNRVCKSLKRDVPVITNVDVTSTSLTTGTITVRWVPPIADSLNLDTIAHPGPYKYFIYRGTGYINPTAVANTITANNFAGAGGISSITSFSDASLNTDANPYVYRVKMVAQGGNDTTLCSTKTASSVYLTLTPNDKRLTLNWNFNVPWTNYKYHIYRSIPSLAIPFTLIDSTTATTYTNRNLVNGRQYCYKIKAYGQYSDTTLPRPLINWSEEKCGSPRDLTPPCPPVLSLTSNCSSSNNQLNWTNPNLMNCADSTNDVVSYQVYYAPVEGQDMTLLATVPSVNILSYLHDSLQSVAGCYAVVAVDSAGNKSVFSNIACADNCPVYELPNVFTPNGDGQNDFFVPFPYKYVKDIDLVIYNRWGEIVFTTTDPAIKWDGKNKFVNQMCSDGVYYYICVVNEIRLKGIKPRTLKGFVEILQHK